MTDLLDKLLQEAKKNKADFKALKELAVRLRQYEFAILLRGIEKELFPETETVKQAKQLAGQINKAFAMVDIKTDDKTAWLLAETLECLKVRQREFNMLDAYDIQQKQKEIWNDNI